MASGLRGRIQMESFELFRGGVSAAFCFDENEYSGVKKVADKVKNDIFNVSGIRPSDFSDKPAENIVIYGTAGKSRIFEEFGLDGPAAAGRREVYSFMIKDVPAPGIKKALVIAGSDRLGTIYGLFHISELIGVSPLTDWSDVRPVHRDEAIWSRDVDMESHEPSVRYRGFFINDEWPAFGSWCMKRFGGFNAEMYDHVFELLLRLKGNYLWPAMWSACFSLDGPDLGNAELADEYGITMGLSHHEPCLRSGEEYRMMRGKDSQYGDAWDFRTNRDGITRFWEDGLKRSGAFRNVITMGMRGERDSAVMGNDATLGDNIRLLKDVIQTQNALIKKYVNEDLKKVPRMLALYKEVEPYFYGDEDNPGLVDYEELQDVIYMLCDDNHGYLRTLPDEKMRAHSGGFGLYYHFDYHGEPVSYEWTCSTCLPQIWEQLSTAYEYGIRELWIVNVGDLALQEFPLSYFMGLAYNFDRWGTNAVNSTDIFTKQWIDTQFGGCFSAEEKEQLADVMKEYTKINNNCRPEHLKADTYQANDFETAALLHRIDALTAACTGIYARCPEDMKGAFFELVYYNAAASVNVHRLMMLAGMNAFAASRGMCVANTLAEKMMMSIKRDRELTETLHSIDGGRWYGFGKASHIGFRHWNDEEAAYPEIRSVVPVPGKHILAGVQGSDVTTGGGEWTGRELLIDEFMDAGAESTYIYIASCGDESVEYEVQSSADWLEISAKSGTVSLKEPLSVIEIRRTGFQEDAAYINIDTEICHIRIKVLNRALPPNLPPGEYEEERGRIVIGAEQFISGHDTEEGKFAVLTDAGRHGSCIRSFPLEKDFLNSEDVPYTEYAFRAEGGVYELEFEMRPMNPYRNGGRVYASFAVNGSEILRTAATGSDYTVGSSEEWCSGVMEHIRRVRTEALCVRGRNMLRIYAGSPEAVYERMILRKKTGRSRGEEICGTY